MIPAVTPEELRKEFTLTDSMIQSINKLLREKYDGRGYVIYYGGNITPNPLTYPYVGLIIDYYGAAGWNVTVTNDQRDGNYLSFKARPQPII